MQPYPTCMKTIGGGTPTTQSREVTGLETKTPFISCAKRHQTLFTNLSLMDYHLAEHKKAKFTKEPLEVSPSNTGQEDRRTDVVQLPIGQAMPCYTPCSEDHLLTIVNFLLNTLLWI